MAIVVRARGGGRLMGVLLGRARLDVAGAELLLEGLEVPPQLKRCLHCLGLCLANVRDVCGMLVDVCVCVVQVLLKRLHRDFL